jgi:hypothetical protein
MDMVSAVIDIFAGEVLAWGKVAPDMRRPAISDAWKMELNFI